MSNARKNQVPNARDQYTTLVVTDEHGKEIPIEYAVDYERAPDAIEAVARLYAYLGDRLPFIAGVLRSDICTKHISPCLLCDELLGDLFAVVDHFMTTERDTIRAAYQKIWPSEEEESQTAEEEDDEKDEGLLDAKKAILASLGEPWEDEDAEAES
jgi:hypothetical protein